MKKIILPFFLLIGFCVCAQDAAPELNCYNKWASKFDERGADKVEDGIYEDVIITSRQGSKATCYRGKAEVKEGLLIRFYTLLHDGTYEEFKRAWKNSSNVNVAVVNGMSTGMLTIHNELINVIWPSKIKPKKSLPVVAADPVED